MSLGILISILAMLLALPGALAETERLWDRHRQAALPFKKNLQI